jgi:hypothetical protein
MAPLGRLTSEKSTRAVSYRFNATNPDALPLDENEVAARVAAGELVPLIVDDT